MKNKQQFLVVVAIAVAVAGVAVLLLNRIAGSGAGRTETVTTQLFVAARNLEVGTLIKDMDVKQAPWAGPVPKSAILKKENVVGRGVLSSIYLDEPILDSRLAPTGAGAGLSATIPQGMRAVAVRVNDIIGLAGFVTPGMRVDVLIAGNPPGAGPALGTVSKTLLQNIEVLSAGQNLQRDNEGKPITVQVVNLLVTPEQAETLSLASGETKIQLVLRNPLDKEVVKTGGTAVANLFSGQKYGVPSEAPRPLRRVVRPAVIVQPVKEKPPVVVEVIQGNQRNSVKFTEESR